MTLHRFLLALLLVSVANTSFSQSPMTLKYTLPDLFTDTKDDFIVIAHRGASAYAPENTMAAFREAVKMKAEMIELDVLLSKDGVPVVIHDAKVNRTTGSRGRVKDYTALELKQMDAGSWFDKSFAGEGIPTLDEVLKFAKGTIALNIEIKTEAVSNNILGGIEEKSLALVEKHGMQNHVFFSSFDYRAIVHLKELDPSVAVALLYNKSQSGGKEPSELIEQYHADAFNCSYRQFNKKRSANLSEHGIPTFVYTVDDKRKMKELIQKNVTGIFTNKPDVLREVANGLTQNEKKIN